MQDMLIGPVVSSAASMDSCPLVAESVIVPDLEAHQVDLGAILDHVRKSQ